MASVDVEMGEVSRPWDAPDIAQNAYSCIASDGIGRTFDGAEYGCERGLFCYLRTGQCMPTGFRGAGLPWCWGLQF